MNVPWPLPRRFWKCCGVLLCEALETAVQVVTGMRGVLDEAESLDLSMIARKIRARAGSPIQVLNWR